MKIKHVRAPTPKVLKENYLQYGDGANEVQGRDNRGKGTQRIQVVKEHWGPHMEQRDVLCQAHEKGYGIPPQGQALLQPENEADRHFLFRAKIRWVGAATV